MCYVTPPTGNLALDRALDRNRRARQAKMARDLDRETERIERDLERYSSPSPIVDTGHVRLRGSSPLGALLPVDA